MLTPDAAIRLIRRSQALALADLNRLERQALLAWVATSPAVDDRGLARFLDLAAPILTATRRRIATRTAGTLTAYLRLAEVRPDAVQLVDLVDELEQTRPARDIVREPVSAARWAIGEDRPLVEADSLGRARLSQSVHTAGALAAQRVEHAVVAATAGIVGWRRVPDPKACEQCLAAAMQRYRTSNLRAIHEHCHCGVAPIIGRIDPGPAIATIATAQLADLGSDPETAAVNTTAVADPVFGMRLQRVSR